MPLRLRVVMSDAGGPRAADLGGPTQHWLGGGAIGGTLDTSLRGQPDGPQLRCAIRDLDEGAPAVPPSPGALVSWDLVQINPGERRAPDGAEALLVVSMNVAPEAEEEFNAWYDTEHLPALVRVPGVICGRRFRSETGQPRYVAAYHLEGRETYASEPTWLAVDQTPWIRRLRRFQRDRRYYMFRPDPAP
jgi:hypothetical protein